MADKHSAEQPKNTTQKPRAKRLSAWTVVRDDWGRGHNLLPELRDLALHYGLCGLPTEVCSSLGAWLGRTMGRRHHPVAATRSAALIAQLRPDLDDVGLEASNALLWENVGRTFAEFSVLQRILPEGRSQISNTSLLDIVLADERPLILCFVHLGNWEVLGAQVCTHPLIYPGRPFIGLVMPPENRAHAFICAKQRRMLPVDLVQMGPRAWHAVTQTLRRRGGIAWIAADEVAGRRVFAPHFGRRIRSEGNLGKIVRLAAANSARILPIYSERLIGANFVSHILPPIEVPYCRLDAELLCSQIAKLDAVFAPIVSRFLDQWYMATEFCPDPLDPVRYGAS
jgi:KDO2-lipid IV(A) lauroyltransferase